MSCGRIVWPNAIDRTAMELFLGPLDVGVANTNT